MHGVGWDWVASRFSGVPEEEAIWRIGEACEKWAYSPNRVKQAASARKRKSRRQRRKRTRCLQHTLNSGDLSDGLLVCFRQGKPAAGRCTAGA